MEQPKINTQEKGRWAEKKALDFLITKDMTLLVKNYRCYFGEIDLIMQDPHHVVFVEVRNRSRIDYGNAAESVSTAKMRKLGKTAIHFLQKRGCLYKVDSRFDIIALHPIAGQIQIEWFKNAFTIESLSV